MAFQSDQTFLGENISELLCKKNKKQKTLARRETYFKVIFSKNIRNQSNRTKASVGTDVFSKTIKEITVWVAQQWDVEVASLKAVFFNGLFW